MLLVPAPSFQRKSLPRPTDCVNGAWLRKQSSIFIGTPTKLIVDINDPIESAAGDKAREGVIRRLRRALDA